MKDKELADLADRFRKMLRLAVFVLRRLDSDLELSTTQVGILTMCGG